MLSGLTGQNESGKTAVKELAGDSASSLGSANALALAPKIEKDTVLFFLNPQRIWEQADILQGIWNLREPFKTGGQMLVLVTTPGATLPVKLESGVMVIDEPLPSPPSWQT